MPERCLNCGKIIHQADAWGKYWYHPEGQTVYCDRDYDRPLGVELRAQPFPMKTLKRPTPEGVGRI